MHTFSAQTSFTKQQTNRQVLSLKRQKSVKTLAFSLLALVAWSWSWWCFQFQTETERKQLNAWTKVISATVLNRADRQRRPKIVLCQLILSFQPGTTGDLKICRNWLETKVASITQDSRPSCFTIGWSESQKQTMAVPSMEMTEREQGPKQL